MLIMLIFFLKLKNIGFAVFFVLQLWVGPGSKAAEEKEFFDSHLAPFYRIEQVSVACNLFYFSF